MQARTPSGRRGTTRSSQSGHPRRGAMLVFAAILLVVVFAMVAFAIDIGNVCYVKTDAQAVADAAALAGARGLSVSTAQVQSNALACAALNKVNGKSVTLQDSNVVVGTWNTSTLTFTPVSGSSTTANACQVTVPFTTAAGDPVSTYFGSLLGVNTVNVSASAIAGAGRWDVVIVIDRSSSFSADLATAVAGIQDILTEMNQMTPTSWMGVVSFDGVAYTNAALQEVGPNYSTLQSDINSLVDCAVGGPPCSGSDLAEGMAAGIALFSQSNYSPPLGTRKAIIFVSDGAANVTSQCVNSKLSDAQDNTLAATEAANAYNNSGISVFSLLYYHGSDSQTDINAMEALVQGQGVYVQEATGSQLEADLKSIFQNNLSMSLVQ
jgi:Flp pilus assembly protein TadG